MRAHVLAAATVSCLMCFGVQSIAAPKPVCRLVKDVAKDTATPSADPATDAQLDILSADVATNKTHLTVVLRARELKSENPSDATGRTYEFDFSVGRKNFIVLGVLVTGGDHFGVYISEQRFEEGQSGSRAATGIGPAEGVLDLKSKEIRITTPLATFAPHTNMVGASLDHLVAFTYRAHGGATNGLTGEIELPAEGSASGGIGVDQAWAHDVRYRAGTPSCVPVGR